MVCGEVSDTSSSETSRSISYPPCEAGSGLRARPRLFSFLGFFCFWPFFLSVWGVCVSAAPDLLRQGWFCLGTEISERYLGACFLLLQRERRSSGVVMNILYSRILTVGSVLVILASSWGALRGAWQEEGEDSGSSASQPQLYEVAAEKIVKQTNQFRDVKGLEPVETNEELQLAAERFARFMARTNKYGHYADGRRPSARAEAAGYEYCVVRDNIAYRLNTAEPEPEQVVEFFVEGWKESEEHRENMLASHVTETGVAVASADGVKFFGVQLFGRPESAKYEIRLRNETDVAQTVVFASEDNRDELTVPPRVVLSMSRCLPTRITLVGEGSESEGEASAGGSGLRIESSVQLEVVDGDAGKVELVRRDG